MDDWEVQVKTGSQGDLGQPGLQRNPALNSNNKRVGFVCFSDSLTLAQAGQLYSQSDSISDLRPV